MIGEAWWSKLVNSARFLDDITYALSDDDSVLLIFDKNVPWSDIMTETLKLKLESINDSRTFDVFDVSEKTEPGVYLMERYCSSTQRSKYWPTIDGSHENFLAHNKETPLNKRYVCLTGIKAVDASKWVDSVSEYIKNCENKNEHGVFILIVEGTNVAESKHMTTFRYDSYVTDYDCMMLCLTLVSDLNCSRGEKMYLCEVASNIAHNDVKLAAMLAASKLSLIQDTYKVAQEVFDENDVKVTNLYERVRKAIWEAQIKLVFPKIENFRAELIKKYEDKISYYLPITNSFNEIINDPSDLEIGLLFRLCKQYRSQLIISQAEYTNLSNMRDARNKLAHLDTLTYAELKMIKAL